MFKFVDRAPTEPFLTEIAYYHMHTPFLGSTTLNGKGKSNREEGQMNYRGSLQELDDSVGNSIAGLESRGILQNTAIIFMSDNGVEAQKYSPGSSGPWRGCKRDLWEGGHHVAGLLHWPEKLSGNYETSYPVASYDILPTVKEILDPSYDSCGDATLTGESWIPFLNSLDPSNLTPSQSRCKTLMVTAFGFETDQGVPGNTAFYSKDGQYKYYPEWNTGKNNKYAINECYDLIADPGETNPVPLSFCEYIRSDAIDVMNTHIADRQRASLGNQTDYMTGTAMNQYINQMTCTKDYSSCTPSSVYDEATGELNTN